MWAVSELASLAYEWYVFAYEYECASVWYVCYSGGSHEAVSGDVVAYGLGLVGVL